MVLRILRSYFFHHPGHRALCPPYLTPDIITLWTITFFAEETVLRTPACSGAQTRALGRSCSLLTLGERVTSPGLRTLVSAHTLLAVAATRPLLSHLQGPKRQALNLNIIYLENALSPTQIPWLLLVLGMRDKWCPGTMSWAGRRISLLSIRVDMTMPVQPTHQTEGG